MLTWEGLICRKLRIPLYARTELKVATGHTSSIACHNHLSHPCSGVKTLSYSVSRPIKKKINQCHSKGSKSLLSMNYAPLFLRILTLMTDLFFSIRKKYLTVSVLADGERSSKHFKKKHPWQLHLLKISSALQCH